jgi:hypothetical protein
MHKVTTAVLVVAALLAGGVHAGSAQSLADIAKKEETRRKELKGGKTYTNKDLGAVPEPAAPPPATSTPSSGSSSSGASGASSGSSEVPAAKPQEAKDQAYWSGRMKGLVTQVERDQSYATAMESRVNGLSTDFVNRDDPAQRAAIAIERDKATAELNRLRNAVIDGQKAIAALEDEARRANVPPGWLR